MRRFRSLALTLWLGFIGAACGLLPAQTRAGSAFPTGGPYDASVVPRMGACGNHPCANFADAPQVLSLFLQPQGFNLATAVGDFNGDGIPDVAAATLNVVSVYLGNGDGTFGSAIVSEGNFPETLVTGDFNNDGKLDLMMAVGQGLLLLLGNGDGTFQPPTFVGPAVSSLIAVGDFNNDGNLDVVSYDGSANLYVFLGDGKGKFSQSADISVSYVGAIAVGQITNDHNLDIAVTSYSPFSDVTIYLGNGDGTFARGPETPTPFGPNAVAIDDVNGDGNNDVVALCAGEVVALLGYGDGTFQPPIISPVPASSNIYGQDSLAISDFNHDGIPDVAVVGYILLGAGDGSFPTAIQYPLIGNFFFAVIAADLNGDHKPDLVVSGQESYTSADVNFVSILLGKGDAAFRGPPDISLGASPESVATADFNGDGLPDFVTANQDPNSLSVALGTGHGSFQQPNSVPLSFSPHLVAAGDFNGDGNVDVVVSSTIFGSPTLAILLGDGAGGFGPPAFIPGYFESVAAIALGDVNNDGNLDIVVPGAVFLGKGDGTFQAPISVATTIGAQSLALADFNYDGKLDLAAGEGSLHILLGNGNGTFTPKVTIPVSNGTSTLAIADFNKDGKLDVAIAGGNVGVSVFLGNGSGTFQPELVSSSTLPVQGSLIAADFNLDGKISLALLSQDSVSFLAGNGDGTFQEAQIFPVELGASGMAEAALNSKNAKPGLVVANTGSNTVSVLTNVTKGR